MDINALEKISHLTSIINHDSNYEATDLFANSSITSFRENFDYRSKLSNISQEQFNNNSFEDSSNEYDPDDEETEESEEEVTSSEKEALNNEGLDQIQLLNYKQAQRRPTSYLNI
ncbi:hypothetical protein F8M41_008527 [Gigaspora margarita]|uniref:Uncharacterized protein n=1 Tax=Gigaspora margarita TaxID=4874 RepID=A0A8H4B480_GIGMA|nr:hypothetical protein F8M41_008527 [Gigaspora margarita]